MRRLVSWLMLVALVVVGGAGCAGDTKSKAASGEGGKATPLKERQQGSKFDGTDAYTPPSGGPPPSK
jgi:hypothetical protein